MSVLRNIERKIGGLVEGVFGRTFRSSVQPVELARKLAKEMDDHRTISIHRVYVPNEYTVYLNPADREQFSAYEAQMTAELEEYLVEHARREGYSIASRPRVLIETEPDLTVGMFGIAVATAADADHDAPAAVAAQPPPVEAPPLEPPAVGAPVPAADLSPPPAAVPSSTMIYAPEPEPEPEPQPVEQAVLEWNGGSLSLTGHVTSIGRSSDCTIVLSDPNVSRRHAEIRHIGEGYSLIDLGSTNGTEVNGQRIVETALMNGDVINVGQTKLTFERRLG
ncbi:MAG: FhaA domain-containing protein [Gaiellales bacterium]